jgi:hypothetical protein
MVPEVRHPRVSALSLVLVLVGSVSSEAQTTEWFGEASFGPVVQDRHGNNGLRQTGLVVQTRVGRRLRPQLVGVLELTHTSITRSDVAFPASPSLSSLTVPCPEGDPEPCGPETFFGPVKSLIAGAGVEARLGAESANLFASIAPGMYWLYERAPGTQAASAGIGMAVGGSLRLVEPLWGVLHLRYHRVFSEGPSPRWAVPIAIGLQVR